jgi:[ribosomal protein S5]-alanine N-acetyltransferase
MSANEIRKIFDYVESERLILREPIIDDLPSLFTIHSDPETNLYNPHGPMKTSEKAIEYLQEWMRYWDRDGFGYWTILRHDSSEIIGFGRVRRIKWAEQEMLNLYYRFSTNSWGYGYATEIAQSAVQLSQKYMPEFPIIARISPINKPSIKVAQKVGMTLKPEISDSEFNVFILQ